MRTRPNSNIICIQGKLKNMSECIALKLNDETHLFRNRNNRYSVKFLKHGGLVFRNKDWHAGWNFLIIPFVPAMIICYRTEQMKKGFRYQFFSNNLGSLSIGPTGHPGDGEFESYAINFLDINVTYTPTQIILSFRIKTDKGQATFRGFTPDPKRSAELSCLEINWKFSIPVNNTLQQFLQISQTNFDSFKKCLEKC